MLATAHEVETPFKTFFRWPFLRYFCRNCKTGFDLETELRVESLIS